MGSRFRVWGVGFRVYTGFVEGLPKYPPRYLKIPQ